MRVYVGIIFKNSKIFNLERLFSTFQKDESKFLVNIFLALIIEKKKKKFIKRFNLKFITKQSPNCLFHVDAYVINVFCIIYCFRRHNEHKIKNLNTSLCSKLNTMKIERFEIESEN